MLLAISTPHPKFFFVRLKKKNKKKFSFVYSEIDALKIACAMMIVLKLFRIPLAVWSQNQKQHFENYFVFLGTRKSSVALKSHSKSRHVRYDTILKWNWRKQTRKIYWAKNCFFFYHISTVFDEYFFPPFCSFHLKNAEKKLCALTTNWSIRAITRAKEKKGTSHNIQKIAYDLVCYSFFVFNISMANDYSVLNW